ncbi:MAG: peptide chain release factor N(5)-glutamine methyltransferase [Actinomycetes bacterium]
MRPSATAFRSAVIGDAAAALAEAGVDSAQHEAEVLAAHVLGVGRSELASAPMFTGQQFETFSALVRRRTTREPLQYLVGSAPFRHLDVLVGPGAFIPRPETELVAGWAIDTARTIDAPVVVDLCSGPGTIALAIAQEAPNARVHAVEIDADAAAWAARNIAATGLQVQLHVADVVDALTSLNGDVDVVVANPPYLTRGTIDQPEVRDFEPDIALYDGEGLGVIDAVVHVATRLLRPRGHVVVEHGDDQGGAVTGLLAAAGFTDVADHRDLTGRDRFSTGRAR